MNDRTVTPKWRLTRVSQEDDDDLKLTCVGQTESSLEITTDGKTTLNTSLTVKGPLTLSQPISGAGGTVTVAGELSVTSAVKVAGGLTVTGPVEVPGGISGPGAVPRGVILMWTGDPARPPEGWALCDGNNGTPNMRAKFPVGADGGWFKFREAGGTASHNHDIKHQMPLKAYRKADGEAFDVVAPGSQLIDCKTHDTAHLPPFMPLHFIMKL
ncbi:hypothetical protein [Ancylobacter sp.]|uniref:hypothetical protein n=1 Tax=Ancylobacter sp. TaxID=1872567 RepID=UPI003BAA21A7